MSYQPVLHGALPQIRPLFPSGGSVRYTSAPVRELACSPTSGTPRCDDGIAVLPAGSVFWKSGRAKTWLKPPPASIQAISRLDWFWQFAGGLVLSTPVPVFALVQRYVPPTPVTSGSEAGHSTVGNGTMSLFGFLPTRLCFVPLAVPPSPDEPRTVTPIVDASTNASRRFISDFELPNASSVEAKLCEMTWARWFFTT